jgi:hypothetical protein
MTKCLRILGAENVRLRTKFLVGMYSHYVIIIDNITVVWTLIHQIVRQSTDLLYCEVMLLEIGKDSSSIVVTNF